MWNLDHSPITFSVLSLSLVVEIDFNIVHEGAISALEVKIKLDTQKLISVLGLTRVGWWYCDHYKLWIQMGLKNGNSYQIQLLQQT